MVWSFDVFKLSIVVSLYSNFNKAIVDIRLRPRCAVPSPPSRLIGRIACAQNFPDSYLRLPGILNEPFCSECGSDGCSQDCQCFWVAPTTPKNAPSLLDFVTLPEEDREMATGNRHRKIGKDRAGVSGDMLADRQTETHRHTHKHTQTCLSQYFAIRFRGRSN